MELADIVGALTYQVQSKETAWRNTGGTCSYGS